MTEGLKLTDKEMKYISFFEATMGASVIDCVDDNELIVFVVRGGEMRRILRRGGRNLKRLSRLIKRKIKVVEHAEDAGTFIRNALSPAKIMDLRLTERPDGRKIAVVAVVARDKGLAIGRGGKTIDLVRSLAKRHYGIDQVVIQ